MRSRSVVGVLGAGPAGLVFAKELKEAGCEVLCWDKNARVGGAFATTYKHATLTTSNLITSFSSWAPDIEVGKMWTAEEYLAYLEAYVDAHALEDAITLNCAVSRVVREKDGRFAVHHANGVDIVDRVVVATGTNQRPFLPPHVEAVREATGTCVLHASEVVDMAEVCRGKRVLLIGGGESASDLSLLGARTATELVVSARSGPGAVVPRFFESVPGDILMCRAFYSLHANDEQATAFWRGVFGLVRDGSKFRARVATNEEERLQLRATSEAMADNVAMGRFPNRRFGTKNTSLYEAQLAHGARVFTGDIALAVEEGRVVATFADGTRLDDLDVIVAATGYTNNGRFSIVEDDALVDFDSDVRSLFKHMYHPRLGADVVFAGFVRPAFGAVPPCAEMQARLHAAVLKGDVTLPKGDEMAACIAADREWEMRRFAKDAPRLSPLTDYLYYMEGIAELLDCSPAPLLAAMRRDEPELWRRIMYGPLCAAHYRLRGIGATPEAARAHLARQPRARRMVDRGGWLAHAAGSLIGAIGISVHQHALRRAASKGAPLVGM